MYKLMEPLLQTHKRFYRHVTLHQVPQSTINQFPIKLCKNIAGLRTERWSLEGKAIDDVWGVIACVRFFCDTSCCVCVNQVGLEQKNSCQILRLDLQPHYSQNYQHMEVLMLSLSELSSWVRTLSILGTWLGTRNVDNKWWESLSTYMEAISL
jgi:hypothetical protein